MVGAGGPEEPKRSLLQYAAVRWLVASSVAISITVALFAMMTRLIDGSFILDRMLRVFPLNQTPLIDPCEVWQAEQTFIPIEGVIGHYGDSGFVPRPDAHIVGEHRRDEGQQVEVSQTGVFSFLTGFVAERPESCTVPAAPGALKKRLIIRAPGCVEREVPVSRSWIPHRVLLECGPAQTEKGEG